MSEGLFSVEEARHPMWTAPKTHEALTGHVRALRKEVARQLRRFDGREHGDMEVVTSYCQQVYEATLVPKDHIWLLGSVVFLTAQAINSAQRFIDMGAATTPQLRRDIEIIKRLGGLFAEAITKEVLS